MNSFHYFSRYKFEKKGTFISWKYYNEKYVMRIV